MPRNTRRPASGIGHRERVAESATTRQPTGSGDLYGLAGYWLRLVSETLDTYTPCRGCKRPRSRHGSPTTPTTAAQIDQTGRSARPRPPPPGTGPTRQPQRIRKSRGTLDFRSFDDLGGGCGPGLLDDEGFFGGGLTRLSPKKPGRDEGAPEFDDHVGVGRMGLGAVPGLVVAAGGGAAAAVAVAGAPEDVAGV